MLSGVGFPGDFLVISEVCDKFLRSGAISGQFKTGECSLVAAKFLRRICLNSIEIFESFAATMTQPDKNYRNKQD